MVYFTTKNVTGICFSFS